MKWLSFKTIIISVLLCSCWGTVGAQNGYEQRVIRYKSTWEHIVPTHVKMQYAGGLGVVSAGVGWDYGKRDQWETDVMLGFVPKYNTKRAKVTYTIKQNFYAWNNIQINDNITIDPLSCSLALNTILGDDFWGSEPDKYPSGYYSFSTKFRFWVGLGQRITFNIPQNKRYSAKSVTLFYELSSNDLYLVTAFNNSSIKPSDFLRLAFGVKFQIF